MLLLAVNFHYVADSPPSAPRAIFPVSTADLADRIDALARSFEFVSRDDLLAAAEGAAGALPARACLVTFDDGLRAQAELALPVLTARGVPAVFFVCGSPYAESRVLPVHKLHHVRELLTDEELTAAVERELGADRLAAVPDAAPREAYAYDTPAAARLKYLLNRELSPDESERVVDALFAALVPDEAAFARDLYMSRAQIRELERSHAAIGVHGYSHRSLASLTAADLRADLDTAAEVVGDLAGKPQRAISYPFGSRDAVNGEVARAAARTGFRIGFTMERAFNRSLEAPLLLARVDANDIPGGKRPLFELTDRDPVVGAGMSPARRTHFEEAA